MFFKLLTVVVVIIAAAWVLAGGRAAALPGRGAARTPARVPRADDLVRCGRCGVWRPAGQGCDCGEG